LSNIFGQGIFQISVIMAILFNASWLPDANWQVGNIPAYPPPPENVIELLESNTVPSDSDGSVHWTIIFNAFVMMQLANQVNARKLQTVDRLLTTWEEWNVFKDITKNKLFIIIVLFEFAGQVLIVQFADKAFYVKPLTISQWIFCIGIGLVSFFWQFVVNCVTILIGRSSLIQTAPGNESEQHANKQIAVQTLD
jgi:Ca2+ transporting ATPase